MKRRCNGRPGGLAEWVSAGLLCLALPAAAGNAISMGVRTHVEHETFTGLPYGKDDIALTLMYEYHEPNSLLQFGVEVTPDLSGTIGEPAEGEVDPDLGELEMAVSPVANVIFKDGMFRGGLGVRVDWISGEDGNDWSDIYWQFLLGLHFGAAGRLGVDLYSVYAFEEWSELSDFEGRDLEFGGAVTWAF